MIHNFDSSVCCVTELYEAEKRVYWVGRLLKKVSGNSGETLQITSLDLRPVVPRNKMSKLERFIEWGDW